ncbi:MAG: chromosomal replication initiator protein DnaA [Ruminococcus sp.]|jgi:chromosomal replication initiator protein|nr:chromosomal replication initiator protein DnaA [Ruminococcus sp.]
MNSFNEVFINIKKHILDENIMTTTAYDLWINCLRPVRFDGVTAVFEVDSGFQREIITKNYFEIIKKSFLEVIGIEPEIVIIDLEKTDTEEDLDKEELEKIAEKHSELDKSYLNGLYELTFDTFIKGGSNEFAYAACLAITTEIDKPSPYNPLFIYGESGLGKTHLLNAIYNKIKSEHPAVNIIYVTSENFSNEFINIIQHKQSTSEFHNKYRNVDFLLLDDVQFIAGKESIQQEFFHTFNELKQKGKQIVLTSDRPPKDIEILEDRIRTRLESGVITDIGVPDFETRVAIIKRKAELLNFYIDNEVCEFIAKKLKTNIRQLEGAVSKLKSLKHLTNATINVATAQGVVIEILKDEETPITIDKIIAEIAEIYRTTPQEITSNTRTKQISNIRKIAMYVSRELTDLQLGEIGKHFGGRDHSTVIYSISSLEKEMNKNEHTRNTVNGIIQNLNVKK